MMLLMMWVLLKMSIWGGGRMGRRGTWTGDIIIMIVVVVVVVVMLWQLLILWILLLVRLMLILLILLVLLVLLILLRYGATSWLWTKVKLRVIQCDGVVTDGYVFIWRRCYWLKCFVWITNGLYIIFSLFFCCTTWILTIITILW